MMERGHESKVRLSRELNVFISELIILIVPPYEMQAYRIFHLSTFFPVSFNYLSHSFKVTRSSKIA